MYSNVTTSTRNKFFKCTYVHLCLFHSKLPHWFQCVPIYIGLLAKNATWCQNRGCICISSTRRTYSRIHAVPCIHPVIQTTTRIILWTELFPKKRREKIQGEILQRPHSSSNPKSVSSVSTRNPASYKLILYTELILQEIQENYNNYQTHPMQACSSNCFPCIQAFYTAESSSKHPTVFQALTAQAGSQ